MVKGDPVVVRRTDEIISSKYPLEVSWATSTTIICCVITSSDDIVIVNYLKAMVAVRKADRRLCE